MSNSTDNMAEPQKSAGWRLPFLLSAILIVPFWVIISVPGYERIPGDRVQVHGWPCLQMESLRVDDGGFFFGAQPQPGSSQQVAEDWLASLPEPESMFDLQFDLRFGQDYGIAESFWSDSASWPYLPVSDGFACRWHWFGLFANLILLSIVVFCVGLYLRRRVRLRGRLFSMSLWELILFVTLCAIPFAAICREYDRAAKEKRLIDIQIEKRPWNGWSTDSFIRTEGEYKLPMLLSQLVDHKHCFPNSEVALFQPVTVAHVELDADFCIPAKTSDQQKLISFFKEAQFPIGLVFRHTNKDIEWLLNEIHGCESVRSLKLEFYYRVDRDENGNVIDDIEVNLDMSFPRLENLTVDLDEEIDQVKQLRPVLALSNAETIRIEGVTKSGAEFLLKHRQQLPGNVYADLEDKTVANELRTMFFKQFPPWHSWVRED